MTSDAPCTEPESDRARECQQALHGAFHDMRRRAEAAGWSADEVSRALLALATAHVRARVRRAALKWAVRRDMGGNLSA